jgi:hypothetical protein
VHVYVNLFYKMTDLNRVFGSVEFNAATHMKSDVAD